MSNDVDKEVCEGEGDEISVAREASDGDRRAIAHADQAGKLDISSETETHRTLRIPEPPTDTARNLHNMTHVPFRDWCPFCVACRARNSLHKRFVVNQTAGTLPKFHADCRFILSVAESKTQPCVTFVETRSGAVISFMCARKRGHEDMTREILRHFESYGFLRLVMLQRDKEMSIIDVCVGKLHVRERARTVLRFAAKTSHQIDGFVETVHGHIQRSCTMPPDTN